MDIHDPKNIICNFVKPSTFHVAPLWGQNFPLTNTWHVISETTGWIFCDICCGYSRFLTFPLELLLSGEKFRKKYEKPKGWVALKFTELFYSFKRWPLSSLETTWEFLWHHPQVKETQFVEHILAPSGNKPIWFLWCYGLSSSTTHRAKFTFLAARGHNNEQ